MLTALGVTVMLANGASAPNGATPDPHPATYQHPTQTSAALGK
jgi:hypothetical protein